MTRLGIVLAAGEATRLPNKLLLPTRHALPVFYSAVMLCLRTCQLRAVIVREDSLLDAFLDSTTFPVLRFRQPELSIMDRLRRMEPAREILITFADNIYPAGEIPRLGASVRPCCRPGADQLDGWEGTWLRRESQPGLKLAGWILLTRQQWPTFLEGSDLIDGLNRAGVPPIECPAAGWHDVGTPEAYLAYLRGE